MATREQGLTLLTALCLFIGVVVIVQIWLVSAALDAFLSNERSVLVPSVVVSLALFAINAGLLWYVLDFNERSRRGTRDD